MFCINIVFIWSNISLALLLSLLKFCISHRLCVVCRCLCRLYYGIKQDLKTFNDKNLSKLWKHIALKGYQFLNPRFLDQFLCSQMLTCFYFLLNPSKFGTFVTKVYYFTWLCGCMDCWYNHGQKWQRCIEMSYKTKNECFLYRAKEQIFSFGELFVSLHS